MADGGWRMADGRWRMADGGWRMADGGWQMPRQKGPPTFPGCQKVGGPFRPTAGRRRAGRKSLICPNGSSGSVTYSIQRGRSSRSGPVWSLPIRRSVWMAVASGEGPAHDLTPLDRRVASGGRTVATWTLGANQVSQVAESRWHLPL